MSLRSLGPQPTKVCPVSAAWCWLSVFRSCVCPGSGRWCDFVLGCLLPSLLPLFPRARESSRGTGRPGAIGESAPEEQPIPSDGEPPGGGPEGCSSTSELVQIYLLVCESSNGPSRTSSAVRRPSWRIS